MQELEKILEEIQELRGKAGSECTSEDHYIKKAWGLCLDRVVGIIRNHMNDGWMPVERELPPNAKHKGSFCPKVRVMTKFGETYGWYNPDRESWYVLAWFMTDRFLDSEIDFDRGDKPKIVRLPDEVNDKTHILIAWRPLLELYCPERSDNHDGE